MSAREHLDAAEQLLTDVQYQLDRRDRFAAAQVHATLALIYTLRDGDARIDTYPRRNYAGGPA